MRVEAPVEDDWADLKVKWGAKIQLLDEVGLEAQLIGK